MTEFGIACDQKGDVENVSTEVHHGECFRKMQHELFFSKSFKILLCNPLKKLFFCILITNNYIGI